MEVETPAAIALTSKEGSPPDTVVEDASISNRLLHPPPLHHTNTFLSPVTSPSFDVDEFLLSRAPGSTLNEITAELQDYGLQLQNQLQYVVDRDYKEFVNLGSALKAEGPRIARLDWKVTPSFAFRESSNISNNQLSTLNGFSRDDGMYDKSTISSKASGSNLGLDKIRIEVVDVRDHLRSAEDQVQRVLQSKKEAELQQANLTLLVTLNKSLHRLETLLGVSSSTHDHSSQNELNTAYTGQEQNSYYELFDAFDELDDDEDGSESLDRMQANDANHDRLSSRPSLDHRRSSSKYQAKALYAISIPRRRSSQGLNGIQIGTIEYESKKLDLPTIIARASSEHASLMFLKDRAESLGFSAYLLAHQPRFDTVRESLKENLRQLISVLTSDGGASLLLGRSEDEKFSSSRENQPTLASWMEGTASLQDQISQQRAWLESALSTWCDLEPTNPESGQFSSAEVEDAIRKALISTWAQNNINANALNGIPSTIKTPKTPARIDGINYFHQQQDDIDVEASILLPADLVDNRGNDALNQGLIHLYNEILIFVSTKTSQISAISEEILKRKIDTRNSMLKITDVETRQCDIYVRVVWDELARQLMEQLGGHLFFAGRPDIFHQNYTISMAFLAAFEKLAPSNRSRSALRKHGSYTTFCKRWQLPVYFQIRLRNVITQLEMALSTSGGAQFGFPQQNTLPLMTGTKEALELFASPWHKDRHIVELAHRQWKLSLQVLARYRSWVEEELPSDIISSNRRFAPEASNLAYSELNSTSSPTRAVTPTLQDNKADEALLSSLTVIAADLIWLDKQIVLSFEENIVKVFEIDHQGSMAAVKMLKRTLQASMAAQKRIVPLLSTRVTSILKARCAEPLRLVRSVSTQFRTQHLPSSMTTSEPSSFVAQFLRPIRQYLGKVEGKGSGKIVGGGSGVIEVMSRYLDRDTKSQWMTEVVEDFVSRYAASLRTMNKNYESLRRLKRGNVAGGTTSGVGFGSLFGRGNTSNPSNGSNGVEDVDPEAKRMHDQMTLDVEFLAKEIQDFSIVDTVISTDTAAWNRLKEAAKGAQDDM